MGRPGQGRRARVRGRRGRAHALVAGRTGRARRRGRRARPTSTACGGARPAPPFAEGPSRAVLAAALRLDTAATGALLSGSPAAGLEALLAAADAVAAGRVATALVVGRRRADAGRRHCVRGALWGCRGCRGARAAAAAWAPSPTRCRARGPCSTVTAATTRPRLATSTTGDCSASRCSCRCSTKWAARLATPVTRRPARGHCPIPTGDWPPRSPNAWAPTPPRRRQP